ncbi:MAG: late competence development ComFB family protein [Treponema sp.]|nr:late competence development ComFB family protein [Treponema sp.]
MNVHNQMEEIVTKSVNNLFDQLKEINPPWFTCDCENCRMDAISYVLNRVPPKYVVSGRGVIYTAQELSDGQVQADLDALGIEAIRKVNSIKRPYHNTNNNKATPANNNSPVFNFPLITGSVLDGTTFEPVIEASVEIKHDGKLVAMMDPSWNNPCKTFKLTKGTYSFWLKPYTSKKVGDSENFSFTLDISAPGYDTTTYSFNIPVISKDSVDTLNTTFSLKIQDLYLFKSGIENPME